MAVAHTADKTPAEGKIAAIAITGPTAATVSALVLGIPALISADPQYPILDIVQSIGIIAFIVGLFAYLSAVLVALPAWLLAERYGAAGWIVAMVSGAASGLAAAVFLMLLVSGFTGMSVGQHVADTFFPIICPLIGAITGLLVKFLSSILNFPDATER